MRILYLINGLNGGGAAMPVPDVIRAMRAAGHEASVLALMRQDGRAEAWFEDAGIPYRILGPERPGVRMFARLVRDLRQNKPDLLWTSLARATIFGQFAGRLLGIPVVSWQHNAYLKTVNKLILRRSKGLTRQWVADSEAVKAFAADELGIARELIRIWPLFIADPAQKSAAAWSGQGPFRIGSLGRLHPNKRYDVLIRAAARVAELDPELSRSMQFVVAGSGDEQPALEALAASLGTANVHFQGFAAAPQDFLAGLHGYVQPSRNEGMCLAAHEAMLARLPVVATPVGELAHSIIDGKTGFFCDIDDVESLAQALLRLRRDPQHAAAMGAAGRERALQRFGRPHFEASGRAIFEQVQVQLGLPAAP